MMKKIISFFLFLALQNAFCQSDKSVTVEFNSVTPKEAIIELEKIVNYTFYFQDSWLEGLATITKSYDNNLEFILDDIFKHTPLNYSIYNDKIILTLNKVIYDKLPKNYFEQKITSSYKNVNKTPVFYVNKNEKIKNKHDDKVIIIGKQNKNSNQSTYTLKGIVKDINGRNPVSNVVISIKNQNTITDDKGFFKLQVPVGENILETKLLGYESLKRTIVIYGNGMVNLFVTENIEELDEIVVEANKNKNIEDAVVGVTNITSAGIKNVPIVLGERDLLKVATTLPGITTAGEGANGYNVRGGRADQNLILLDDAILYSPSHFLGFFSAINQFTTGDVDIYKASIPVMFGGRLSSVFDIKTKDGNVEKVSGEGSVGPITANLSVEMPIIKNKSSLIAGVRATYSNWILKSLDEPSLKNSEASFYDGIVKYNHKVNDKNSVKTTFYYSNDDFSITTDSIYNYNNILASFKWKHEFNSKNSAELIAVNSNYTYGINYEGDSNGNFDFDYRINETQVKLNLNYLYNRKHKIYYGLSSKLYQVNPGNIKPLGDMSIIEEKKINKEKGLESAAYISDLFEINDKFVLNLGLRYSVFTALGEATQNVYQSGVSRNTSSITNVLEFSNNEKIKSYGGIEPRVSLRYFISPNTSIKASYNRTFQFLHLLSSNTTVSPTDTWKLSDLNIKPQKANQYTLGVYKNIEDSSLELSLEGYYKKMENLLDYKVGANLILNDNVEQELLQGEGKAYGVELLLKKKKGRLNGWLGYTYSRALVKLDSEIQQERINNGNFFSANYDKPHDISLVANYKLTKRYSISTNFIYQTGRPITFPVGKYVFGGEERVLFSNRNQFRIPDYYRFDIGVNIEGNHKIKKLAHSFWNISIYNILGRNNPYSVFFVTEDNGKIQAYKTSIFSVAIPTITYNFKF